MRAHRPKGTSYRRYFEVILKTLINRYNKSNPGNYQNCLLSKMHEVAKFI
jgi:hypothetical protein